MPDDERRAARRQLLQRVLRSATLRNLGIDFVGAVRIFSGPTLEWSRWPQSYGARRAVALGVMQEVELVVVYAQFTLTRRPKPAGRGYQTKINAVLGAPLWKGRGRRGQRIDAAETSSSRNCRWYNRA